MSKKILVVDDSALSRRTFVAKPLREAGYEVVEAENGQLGLDAIAVHKPDCIVSDLLMPVMDGFEFLQTLHDENSTIPVIVASADIQDSSRQKISELGAVGFLNKPFSKDKLLETVANALNMSVKGAV